MPLCFKPSWPYIPVTCQARNFLPTSSPKHYFGIPQTLIFIFGIDKYGKYDYVIFGGEDVKTRQEENPNVVFTRLEQELEQVLPKAEVQHRWLGQVVETNDGLPFIGKTKASNLLLQVSAATASRWELLSALMARDRYLGRNNPWFDLFSINRRKFHGGTWRYIKGNRDYPYYMLRDRLARADGYSVHEPAPRPTSFCD